MRKVKYNGKVVEGFEYRKVCRGEYEIMRNGEGTGVFVVRKNNGWELTTEEGFRIDYTKYDMAKAFSSYAWHMYIVFGEEIL